MSKLDRDYFRERAEIERQVAATADDDRVRDAHLELARHYDVRANVADVSSSSDNDALGLVRSDAVRPTSRKPDQQL